MDEDNSDGPFTVWQMFNAPTMVLFNNLELASDGLERLLTSILKLSGDFSEVLVPRPGASKYADHYYCSFNTWLLGRLFYVWSVKELEQLYSLSKEAQLKILNILYINGATFYKKIHNDYSSILVTLINYYKNSELKETQIELKNFVPEDINIPVAQLNLEPIFVNVQNLDTCKRLIKLTLDFLSQSICLDLLHIDNCYDEYKSMFGHILYMQQHYSMELKLASLNFFVNLIKNYNYSSIERFVVIFPNTVIEILLNVEAIINSVETYHKKGEMNVVSIQKLSTLINDLLTFPEFKHEDYHDVFKNICVTIINLKKSNLFSKQLTFTCLSLEHITLPQDLIDVDSMDVYEIEAVSSHYVKNILMFIRRNDEQQISINLVDCWYFKQTISIIQKINTYDNNDMNMYIVNDYLQRCCKALHILHMVYVKSKDYTCLSKENLLSSKSIESIWTKLIKVTATHKRVIVGSEDLLRNVMCLVLGTVLFLDIRTSMYDSLILQMICLQNSPYLTENYISYPDEVKLLILKYLLVIKVTLNQYSGENFLRIITFMVNSLIVEKSLVDYKKIIPLCPLLLLTKVYTASKLLAEIYMPALLSRNLEIQLELTQSLPAIVCISLGHYKVCVNTKKENIGHELFSNEDLAVGVTCVNCHTKTVINVPDPIVLFDIHNITTLEKTSTISGLHNLLLKFANPRHYTSLEETGYWKLISSFCRHFYLFRNGFLEEILNVENSHNILKALSPFVNNNLVNNDVEWNSHKDTALSMCINLLVKATKQSLESTDFAQQSQTLNLIKEVGSNRNERIVLPITKLFVYYIMHPQCTLAPKAVVYLRDVCEVQGYTPNQVYHRYKKDYCRLFVDCSLYCGKDFAIALLKVVRAFGFVGYRDFISKDVHHFLPYLIPYSVTIKEVPAMIEEIASLVQCTVSDFLTERFPHIYVHVYLNEPNDVGIKCYELLAELTKSPVLTLVKKHFRVILTEFLLQYCCNPLKVMTACKYLASHDPDVSSSSLSDSTPMTASQIADFLNPKFLGILAYFDHKLVNAKVALSVKRKALKSFPDIMQLMGVKYLTPLRFKVLATLRSALPLAKEFPKILADAWGAFIHNIDTMSLGPLLTNLAVSLLQQLEFAPAEINKIFQYLVLNNENLLSSHISDLFFLEATKISEKVKMVVKRHVKRTQPEGFIEKIKWSLQHLDQDISTVKAHSFDQLNKFLEKNRPEIHKAVFGGKNIDPVIVELIDSLLQGCKDADPQVSAASGRCLGQLGAIEAGHLPRQYVQPDRSPFAFSIGDDCFAATALVELSRAFQYEKDTMNMDCYALTIQEILKMYDISPTGSKRGVWNSFPENMHQIMHPLLSSRYTLAYPTQPKKAHPLFGSQYATTFLEWAHNWAGQLIPLIDSESIRELLRTVHPSMRRDVRTLFLFLPYVLLHAVMANNNSQYILEEMLAVVGLENLENNKVATEKLKYKLLRNIRMTPNVNSVQVDEGNQRKYSKTVYTLLDFLNRWILEYAHLKQNPMGNSNYKAIASFLKKFDKLTIARGNFMCGELERALQYLELYMDENKEKMQEQLPLLAEIYALLDEPDSVAGILSIKRAEPSLKELILTQVVTGRLQDAALCYERLAQEGQLDRHSLKGMIDCYLGLDQPFTAYRLLSEHELQDDLMELSAEPLWRLGRFEQLEELARKPIPACRENWGLLMGKILLSYRAQDYDRFEIACNDANSRLIMQMDGESKGESALRSGYQSVLGLHIVTEAKHLAEVLKRLKNLHDDDTQGAHIINQLLEEWRRRLTVVQSDVRTIEPLLRLRRILLHQTQELLEPTHPLTAESLKSCIGDLWLQSAKHARKAGIFQQSYMYVLNAEGYHPEELFIEKAKMYWARGQQEHAFTTLRRGLDEAYPNIANLNPKQSKICAKAKLLIAKYNDETTNVDVDVNIGYYKESVDVYKEWEKSLVCLGSYYEKVSSSESASQNVVWTRKIYALNSYGKALQYGHKYLYQSMPRMLSIWLDMEVTAQDKHAQTVLLQMTEIIKTYSERLPLYLYLSAFSQIVSRICHPAAEVYRQLKAIIVQLILAYPQHTLWMMMCVIKSSYPTRKKRCDQVFADPRLKEPHILKLVHDFTQLAEKLIDLCNKPIITDGSTAKVSDLVAALPRLLANKNFSHIMMPFQEFCKIVLPSKAARQERTDFNIPMEPPVYIAGVEDGITILPSLQKPRKVTLRGSDGKKYIIMLKPRDDLRKDCRLMEFNGVVNRLLQDAPETRRRRLYIRTYSVLPLNEECGLIEWVPNLLGLRPILMHIYKQKGIPTNNKLLKEMMCSSKDPLEKKRQIYEEQLLPRHPPVFQEWFRRVFSDPYGWYQARSAYIRTTAVMSMVGYILGLGDRHGENVSFDSTNGDTVHVDFNCLFNKGEAFEWPERVPFRLTHNMEAAMGPLKHEGMYRKSCEAVMRALRAQTAALMSVIGPFVYDPLVSWGRVRAVDAGERTNEQALQHLQHIRQRLNGMVRTKNKQLSLSLSPEGQVEHLIVEATSIHNLCQMYIGWGPFL